MAEAADYSALEHLLGFRPASQGSPQVIHLALQLS